MSGLSELQGRMEIPGVVAGKSDFKDKESGEPVRMLKVQTLGGDVSIPAKSAEELASMPEAGTAGKLVGVPAFSRGRITGFARDNVRFVPDGSKPRT